MHFRGWMKFNSATLVTATVGIVLWVNAGSLTPPAGPVSPTMKTLVQVEPRTDVQTLPGDAGSSYIISQPGSYYLTANITGVSGKNGILIDADDVTLDLRGFSLQGVSGSVHGITVACCHHDIAIRNGTITHWDQIGLDAGLGTNMLVEGIIAFQNGNEGIKVDHGSALKDCVAHNNGFRGIEVTYDCTLSHCVSYENSFDGFAFLSNCTFLNCVAHNNTSSGFLGFVCNPAISAPGGQKQSSAAKEGGGGVKPLGAISVCPTNSTFLNCTANNNGEAGFVVSNGSSFQNCAADQNNSDGFHAEYSNTFSNCSATSNGQSGLSVGDSNTIENCSATNNFDAGIRGGNRMAITGSSMLNNFGNGVDVLADVVISHSVLSQNFSGLVLFTGVVSSCAVNSNLTEGIIAFDATTITDCNVYANSASGIRLFVGGSINGCTVSNNNAQGIWMDNSNESITVGAKIRNNNVTLNMNDGILVGAYSLVEGNNCSENGSTGRGGGNGAGIKAVGSRNRIQANHLAHNDRGIEATAAANTIMQNTAGANTDNYGAIIGGNDVGPIGTAAATMSPWANLVE